MRYNSPMTSFLSTSPLAFTRLSQKLKNAIDQGHAVSPEQCTRWLDLLQVNLASVVFDRNLFKQIYGQAATRGEVTDRDFHWIERYDEGARVEALNVARVLHAICEHRDSDALWRRTLWQYDSVRTHILRANMQKQDDVISHGPWTLAEFGPWKLATQWLKDITNNNLEAQGTALEQTWWLYLRNSHKKEMPDSEKKEDIDALLLQSPDSVGGALCFYVARSLEYAPSMASIFDKPVPQEYSGVVFAGLLFSYVSFQALGEPANGAKQLDHVWLHAARAWPEECRMLEVFLSLYPSVEAARPHLSVLANSYEQRSKPNTVELPNLGFD